MSIASSPAIAVAVDAKTLAEGAKISTQRPEEAQQLERAAREFEAIFVRQLLQASKVAGPSADRGYGAMIVDSLASSITEGPGIGLARQIQNSLAPSLASALEAAAGTPTRTDGGGT